MTRTNIGALACAILLLLSFGLGCDSSPAASPPTFDSALLSERAYNFVGLNETGEVVLLGEVTFSAIQGDDVTGSWELSSWGEGGPFVDLRPSGAFSGTVFGDVAILNFDALEGEKTVGLVVEGVRNDRLVGSMKILPTSELDGRFEAIEK